MSLGTWHRWEKASKLNGSNQTLQMVDRLESQNCTNNFAQNVDWIVNRSTKMAGFWLPLSWDFWDRNFPEDPKQFLGRQYPCKSSLKRSGARPLERPLYEILRENLYNMPLERSLEELLWAAQDRLARDSHKILWENWTSAWGPARDLAQQMSVKSRWVFPQNLVSALH